MIPQREPPQALEVPPRETTSGMSMYHSAASGLPEADEQAQDADAQPCARAAKPAGPGGGAVSGEPRLWMSKNSER